ncbi:MAG: hypothetical protein ACJ762_00280 [Solirubrobacteraceae bacterium]
MPDGKRGRKPLGRQDWIFGSAPRRALLGTVLRQRAPDRGWTKADLARASGVSTKGGIDEHVDGLASLGLLQQREGRWFPRAQTRLAGALRDVLSELETLP